MAGRPYKCPYCESTETIWKGYRPLTTGKVRLRQCRKCRRKFTSRQHTSTLVPTQAGDQTQSRTQEVIHDEQRLHEA